MNAVPRERSCIGSRLRTKPAAAPLDSVQQGWFGIFCSAIYVTIPRAAPCSVHHLVSCLLVLFRPCKPNWAGRSSSSFEERRSRRHEHGPCCSRGFQHGFSVWIHVTVGVGAGCGVCGASDACPHLWCYTEKAPNAWQRRGTQKTKNTSPVVCLFCLRSGASTLNDRPAAWVSVESLHDFSTHA